LAISDFYKAIDIDHNYTTAINNKDRIVELLKPQQGSWNIRINSSKIALIRNI
jgi:hypothetical protein